MSDVVPPDDGVQSVPEQGRRFSRRAKVIVLAVAGVVIVAVVVLAWRPWQSASCVDDSAHVVDEETGLRYVIPDGWEQDESDADAGAEGTAIVADDGTGFVMATPIDSTAGDLDLAARMQAALLSGNGPGNEAIQAETGTVDGHESAAATYSDSGIWVMVTVVDLDGRLVGLSSVCSLGESEQVTEVHESLGVL